MRSRLSGWWARWFPEAPPTPRRWDKALDKLMGCSDASGEAAAADTSGPADVAPVYLRHYRVPRAGAWFLRGFMLYVVLLGVLIAADNHSGIPTALLACVYFGLQLIMWLCGERVIAGGGMYESADGLTLVFGWRAVLVRWERIASFEHSKFPRSRVLVRLRNGNAVPVTGAAHGYRTTWADGETKDIVGVLNARLQTWTATTPPDRVADGS